jgi:hypothetical protein
VLAELCPVADLPLYYRHVVQLFSDTGADDVIASFCRKAIEAVAAAAEASADNNGANDPMIRELSYKLFQSLNSSGQYDDAYTTLMSMPFLDMCVVVLIMSKKRLKGRFTLTSRPELFVAKAIVLGCSSLPCAKITRSSVF